MATPSAAAGNAGLASRPSLTLKRRINALPEKVFAAWTDPEKIARWFGPSQVKAGSVRADIDLRVGGRYRISFEGGDGEYFQVDGVYREVSPNARIAPVPLVWSRGPSALCGPYSTAGSSLKLPSASISAPLGNFLPPRLATSTLPSATIDVAKSSTIGSWPTRGMPTQ